MTKLLPKKLKTNLHQYGIWPPRTLNLVSAARPVLANSIPKAGTNLLIRAITQIDFYHRKLHKTFFESAESEFKHLITMHNANKVLVGHLPFNQGLSDSLNENEVAHILMVRDPRDIALSNVHYIQSIDKAHRLHKYFSDQLNSLDDRLSASICGIPSHLLNGRQFSRDIGWHIRRYLDWVNDSRCLVIRFEDLIGENGGGSDERQFVALKRILVHLSLKKTDAEIAGIARKVFNPGSRTFNKGTIGQWKSMYSTCHIDQIERVAGDCIDALGYRETN